MATPDRATVREDVALACRMLEREGLINFSGHVSGRDPEEGMWIHPGDAPRHAVRGDMLVRLALDGRVLEGGGKPPSEAPIHWAIYRARPDVGAVAHLHPAAAITLSIVSGAAYVPVVQHGALFEDGVPVLDDSRHVDSRERGERLAEVLGGHRAALIRGHGAVVVGRTVRECFKACVYFEENAEQLIAAMALGKPLVLPREEQVEGRQVAEEGAGKVWRYYSERQGIGD
jgi:ribulose-5-phosphate 4-epimerase/fuculose-1-phosphate aldolase